MRIPLFLVHQQTLSPHFNAASLRFDGEGRLWVRTFRGGNERTVFDVFSGRLEQLGEVHAPEAFNGPWDLGHGALVGVVPGEFDVPIVKVWRVLEALEAAARP